MTGRFGWRTELQEVKSGLLDSQNTVLKSNEITKEFLVRDGIKPGENCEHKVKNFKYLPKSGNTFENREISDFLKPLFVHYQLTLFMLVLSRAASISSKTKNGDG